MLSWNICWGNPLELASLWNYLAQVILYLFDIWSIHTKCEVTKPNFWDVFSVFFALDRDVTKTLIAVILKIERDDFLFRLDHPNVAETEEIKTAEGFGAKEGKKEREKKWRHHPSVRPFTLRLLSQSFFSHLLSLATECHHHHPRSIIFSSRKSFSSSSSSPSLSHTLLPHILCCCYVFSLLICYGSVSSLLLTSEAPPLFSFSFFIFIFSSFLSFHFLLQNCSNHSWRMNKKVFCSSFSFFFVLVSNTADGFSPFPSPSSQLSAALSFLAHCSALR